MGQSNTKQLIIWVKFQFLQQTHTYTCNKIIIGNMNCDFPISGAAGLDGLTCVYWRHERLNKEFWSSAIERGQMRMISIRACYQTQHMVPNLNVVLYL